MTGEVSRRRLLQAGAALGVGATALGVAGCRHPTHATKEHETDRAVRMAMHIHSSFSEGTASMLAHMDQAQRHGVDVIWWTDHDFRMEGHGYTQRIACDGSAEGQNLSWQSATNGGVDDFAHGFADKALHVTASSKTTYWGEAYAHPNAYNLLYSTNLSDTTLSVEVQAPTGAAAAAFVGIKSSYRPALHGRPAGVYKLQYRVGAGHARSLAKPLLGVVEIAAGPGWQTVTIDPLEDVKSFWPDLTSTDSSLVAVHLGVRVSNGKTATASFRNLEFRRRRDSQPLTWGPRLQASMTAGYLPNYPDVTVYPSTEVSLVRHVNVFMDEPVLYPYTGPAAKNDTPEALQAMVDWYKQRGAIVQYNHPPQTSAAELVAHRGFGFGMIELGRDAHTKTAKGKNTIMGDRIAMFDAAARNGIFLTGTGVTDDHDGDDWVAPGDDAERYVTAVWARSMQRDALRAALSAGRAWWHDRRLWPKAALGRFVAGTPAMGAAWRTSKSQATVTIYAPGLPRGSHVTVITGACDMGGATPKLDERTVSAADFAGTGTLDHTLKSGHYLRVEVHDNDQRVVAFGNPFWLLPTDHKADVPTRRVFRAGR